MPAIAVWISPMTCSPAFSIHMRLTASTILTSRSTGGASGATFRTIAAGAAGALLEEGVGELVFARIVAVDRAGADAGLVRDVLHRDIGESAVEKEGAGSGQNVLFPSVDVCLGNACHVRPWVN
ncbi:MAG: hypothetical protein R2849_04305 [Thermomicrobiales bacterium]